MRSSGCARDLNYIRACIPVVRYSLTSVRSLALLFDKMKVQIYIILSLVATVLAVPNFRSRRDANSTDSTTEASTTPAPSAPDCGSDSSNGLNGLLGQLGNLLDNILANVTELRAAGLVGDSRDLVNLKGLLGQVRELLNVLLGGSSGSKPDTAENRGLVTSLLGQITSLLDNTLGAGTGKEYACTNNGGAIGKLLGGLVGSNGLLSLILKPVLALVGALLKALI